LHPLSKVESCFVEKMTKITIWIIFAMITNINELANELINEVAIIFDIMNISSECKKQQMPFGME